MKVRVILSGGKLINPIVIICTEENVNQVNKLINLFTSSPKCNKELSFLSITPGIKIDFTRDKWRFQGRWSAQEKEIRVKSNLVLEKMLQTFIFELCNANNPDLIKKKTNYSNFNTPDEYALYLEASEHKSFKKAIFLYMDVFLKNPKSLLMPSAIELDQLRMLADDESYLSYVKNNGHYDYYVDDYNRATNKKPSFFTKPKGKNLNEEHYDYDTPQTSIQG
ncbi:hypothetical protein [Legionella waltersii]|uniref:Uncharacterized protein n=1 Tax=Legionella waltersii TaxID=66969 RepID=A0A0W1ALG1_9GAMM|nr:hypothetical protein [Legionella waltersii]KTD82188.1 hypothetical protein Lwal_0665 [Legionella waltersii]SNV10599.1 Uncharacterised protein [Legionella waltersii]